MPESQIVTLEAQPREETGTGPSKRLRRAGRVPAVLYGHAQETMHLALDERALAHAVEHGTQVVALQTPRGVEQALIKEVQYDVYHQHVLHADFMRVALDEAVEVEVPVEVHGEVAEGVLEQTLHLLPVRCRADRIPEKIHVEVEGLHVGDVVEVGALALPEGVSTEAASDVPVVTVHAKRGEIEEEEAAEAPAEGEPEVIGEKEKEGTGEV